MSRPKIRLYVPEAFSKGGEVTLGQNQSHYLSHVMRLKAGDHVAIFNGADGEWLAELARADKKSVVLALQHQREAQRPSPDLWLAFAPLKNKSDLVVEKATELGVSRLIAVYTRHAVVKAVNMEKLAVHAMEAAEQCGRHDVPVIDEKKDLGFLLASWPGERLLLYGDETGGGEALKDVLAALDAAPLGVLIGPEGGFSAEELRMLKSVAFTRPFGMGPRILKADTAAVAALACVQSVAGDWRQKPRFMAKEV